MNLVKTRTRCYARIPWSQWEARDHIPELTGDNGALDWPFNSERNEYWGPRARWLLGAWLGSLGLERGDVITVITTSQERYVGIDVSITAFNFGSISRVVTDRTRVIIVIHELGYVDTDFPRRCEEWRAHGILVLEDCAHVAGLGVDSAKVGDFGDAALFSLCKVIPARVGGLIRTRKPFQLPAMDETMSAATEEGRTAAEAHFPYLHKINNRRQERHQMLRGGLNLAPWDPPCPTVAAPLYSIYDDREQRVNKAELPDVDWGNTTIEPNRVQIPTNPLVPLSEFAAVVDHFQS
jgi:hypothetical protein